MNHTTSWKGKTMFSISGLAGLALASVSMLAIGAVTTGPTAGGGGTVFNIFSTNNNQFITNVIVELVQATDVWTNQSGKYIYLRGQGPVIEAGGPGPGFFFRPDGSLFVGTNGTANTLPTAAGLWVPYAISLTDSNQPNTMHAGWVATDNLLFLGAYASTLLDLQQSGLSTLRLLGQATPTDYRSLAINLGPGQSPFQYNSNAFTPFKVHEDGRFSVTYNAGDGKVMLSDAQGLGTWTTVGFGVGPGTNNFLAKFDSTTTNVQGSNLYSDTTNNIELRQSFNPFISYTNSATNRIYGEWTGPGTNQWVEIVSPKGHNNEVFHIRTRAIGQVNQRAPIYINDTMAVEPGDNQYGGHGLSYVYPIVNQTGGLVGMHGTSSSHWYGYSAGAAGFVIYDQTATKAEVNLGAGDGFGVSNTDINVIHNGIAYMKILNTGAGEQGINIGTTALMGGGAINVHNSFLMFQPNGVVQLGTNNINGAATPQTNRIQGIMATGTDKPGGRLGVAGGTSTGTGANGALDFLTAEKATASTSTGNTLYTRTRIAPDWVTLTTNAATLVFNVTLPTADKMMAGEVSSSVKISDGVDQAVLKERFSWAAIRKAGTVTVTNSDPVPTAYLATGAAVLTTTWTTVVNSTSVDFKCNAVTAGILSTNSTARWRVDIDSDAIPIITP